MDITGVKISRLWGNRKQYHKQAGTKLQFKEKGKMGLEREKKIHN